jgi:predicted MPP superfamily phosphohydrolase
LEIKDQGQETRGKRRKIANCGRERIIGDVPRRFTRRRFIRLMLGSTATVGLSALGGAGYSTLIEPSWLAVKRVDVPLSGLPANLDGFTIAQLSDLHRGPWVTQEDIAQAVELALRQDADLVVLTGDYVSRSAQYAPSCAEALSPLAASGEETPLRFGGIGGGNVLACLGNHDHWTDAAVVAGALADAGVAVLRNAAREVADGLWVAAVDDVWEEHADLEQALEKVPAGAAVVLLAHEPDYADEAATNGRVSVQLSGHSHGGQVRLPLVGPPILPYLARKYHAGLYQVSGMWLYVNRGVGLITPPVRFNCRPEVTLLTLRVPAP